jgi:hypothetical protein
MKSRRRPLFAAAAVLLAAGALRMPVERRLTGTFREEGLLSRPLEIGLREKLGQNSSAIALAGLRTLVATFTHLKVTECFSQQRWPDLEKAMNTTVQLAPRGTYYWDIGAWHIGTNASTYYRAEAGLPELRARAEARRWVAKGREFYQRGIRNNPDDWRLRAALGNLCSDVFRYPDDALAADAYAGAVATGKAPPGVHRALLIAEVRAGRNPEKSLAQVRELLAAPGNRVPTLLCIRYVLERRVDPSGDPVARAVEIFGSEEKALRNLGSYFLNIYDRLPMEGVETVVRLLEYRRGIPPADPRSFIRQRDELPARPTRYR